MKYVYKLFCAIHFLCYQFCFAYYTFLQCKFNANNARYINNQTDMFETQFGDGVVPEYNMKSFTYEYNKKKLNNVMSDIVFMYNYNTVDSILDFYEAFNSSSPPITVYEQFNNFFDKYKPNFKNQGSLKQAVDINLLWTTGFKDGTASRFVATVWHDVNLTTVNDIRKLNKVPDYFYHAHIAPIFRFSHLGRNGYIYVDSEDGMVNAAWVFEDNDDENEQYSMLKESNLKYITMKRKDNKRSLIYVGRPFCSFIQTTAKVRLLTKERKIISRNNLGEPEATLTINLVPDDRNYFTFTIHKPGNQQDDVERIAVDRLDNFMMTGSFANFLRKIRMKYSILFDTLKNMKNLIIDTTFLAFYTRLLREKPKVGRCLKPYQSISQGRRKRPVLILNSGSTSYPQCNSKPDLIGSKSGNRFPDNVESSSNTGLSVQLVQDRYVKPRTTKVDAPWRENLVQISPKNSNTQEDTSKKTPQHQYYPKLLELSNQCSEEPSTELSLGPLPKKATRSLELTLGQIPQRQMSNRVYDSKQYIPEKASNNICQQDVIPEIQENSPPLRETRNYLLGPLSISSNPFESGSRLSNSFGSGSGSNDPFRSEAGSNKQGTRRRMSKSTSPEDQTRIFL